jgi:drug/metabolite transporter (DMT)-like permease
MAVVANIAPYVLFAWGQQHIPSGLAGTLNAATPLFTLLISVGVLAERASLIRILGLMVGFLGVVILSAPWEGVDSGSLSGIIACLLAGFCYAVSYVYARRFLTGRGLTPLVLAAGQLTVGALLLAVLTPLIATEHVQLTPTVIAAVVILGSLSTGAAYILNYRLIQDEGATSASTATYLIPVVALTLGAVVLHERLTWGLLLGAAVVLTGVAMSEERLSRSARSRPAGWEREGAAR